MATAIIGQFETRRGAELAVEHVVQEHGIPRTDVSVLPASAANTAGTRAAGPDAKTAPEPEGHERLQGLIEVSVKLSDGEPQPIVDALKSVGAKTVRTG